VEVPQRAKLPNLRVAAMKLKSMEKRFLQLLIRMLIPYRAELSSGKAYELVTPRARYAPWNLDPEFGEAYMKVKEHTLVDKYRCWELWQLVEQSLKLEGALLEVGAWRGGTAALIAYRARMLGITDPVYICDTFSGTVKASKRDSYYSNGRHADTTASVVESLLSKLSLSDVFVLEGVFPDETAAELTVKKFRFCHIDVDTYHSARDILNHIKNLIVPGGVVVYDDYGFSTCSGITEHVNEQSALEEWLTIHNLNGHAILVKR
jgi:O-methyltransferase